VGRFYDLRIWRDHIRPQKLRQNPLCEYCQERNVVQIASEVDHIDGDPENNLPENHRSACKSCHSAKTARENGSLGREPGLVKEKGCNQDGLPTDPKHHWNKSS
jgi:5-methylcytosine-specific restriction endonuclease McrA